MDFVRDEENPTLYGLPVVNVDTEKGEDDPPLFGDLAHYTTWVLEGPLTDGE